jgi:hypothetical protein
VSGRPTGTGYWNGRVRSCMPAVDAATRTVCAKPAKKSTHPSHPCCVDGRRHRARALEPASAGLGW